MNRYSYHRNTLIQAKHGEYVPYAEAAAAIEAAYRDGYIDAKVHGHVLTTSESWAKSETRRAL